MMSMIYVVQILINVNQFIRGAGQLNFFAKDLYKTEISILKVEI